MIKQGRVIENGVGMGQDCFRWGSQGRAHLAEISR